jgi:hypothetical protein
MQNHWVGFLHVAALAGMSGENAARLFRPAAAPEFLAGQFGAVTPWWMLLLLCAGWRSWRAAWAGQAGRDDPLRERTLAEQTRQHALLACGFWPLWLGLFLWSFHTRVYVNWPGMSHIAGVMLTASGLERLLAGFGYGWARRLAPLWPGAGLLVFLLLLGQHWLPLPSSLDPALRLRGWADMGQRLESLRRTLPNPDKVFYFAHNYDVTAELAFYGPDQPEAYCVNFGRRQSQYDIWPGPADPASIGGDKTGWDAVYVNAQGQIPEALRSMFDNVTPILYNSFHKGKRGRTFALVLLRNFNGYWPRPDYERY